MQIPKNPVVNQASTSSRQSKSKKHEKAMQKMPQPSCKPGYKLQCTNKIKNMKNMKIQRRFQKTKA